MAKDKTKSSSSNEVAASAPETMLVRIKPSNKREVHSAHGYTIYKSEGWCEIAAEDAKKLAKEPMNDRYPDAAPMVFDVMYAEDAELVDESEREREEPSGTADAPKRKSPADPRAEASLPPRNNS